MDALWSQEGKLDPNDPGNAGLITFGNAQEGKTVVTRIKSVQLLQLP